MELQKLTCAAAKDDVITKKLLFCEISHAFLMINAPLLPAYPLCSINFFQIVIHNSKNEKLLVE